MNKRGNIFTIIGLLLIAAALCLTGYNIYSDFRAKKSSDEAAKQLQELTPPPEETAPDYLLNPEKEMPVENLEGIDYIGVLEIPALGLKLPIISRWSYSYLKVAPCRYSGSAYLDNLVIAAHNYSSHFGSLKKLSPGDEITFTDVEGNAFRYQVAVLETLDPTAIEEMTAGDYALTLFTCTKDAKSRTTVRCERAE